MPVKSKRWRCDISWNDYYNIEMLKAFLENGDSKISYKMTYRYIMYVGSSIIFKKGLSVAMRKIYLFAESNEIEANKYKATHDKTDYTTRNLHDYKKGQLDFYIDIDLYNRIQEEIDSFNSKGFATVDHINYFRIALNVILAGM